MDEADVRPKATEAEERQQPAETAPGDGAPAAPQAAEEEPEPAAAAEPAAEEEPAAAEEPAPAAARLQLVPELPRLARTPIAAYAGAWVALTAATVALLQGRGYPPDLAAYRWLVLAALVLAALSPLVVVAEWLLSRRVSLVRTGLLPRSMLWTAAVAAFGVALWWAALTVLDALRLGWL
ncbi:MAG: hypothetical protein IBX62_06290 [Coriobacteriia bacterium]|nr:hypothetical protein [Coriobacteriia bacterium]